MNLRMDMHFAVAGFITLALLVYLIISLVYPERF